MCPVGHKCGHSSLAGREMEGEGSCLATGQVSNLEYKMLNIIIYRINNKICGHIYYIKVPTSKYVPKLVTSVVTQVWLVERWRERVHV